MIYVIEYDRRLGKVLQKQGFSDAQGAEAQKLRLEFEITSSGFSDREVVTLRAASEESLKRTHGRYFSNDPGALLDMQSAIRREQ